MSGEETPTTNQYSKEDLYVENDGFSDDGDTAPFILSQEDRESKPLEPLKIPKYSRAEIEKMDKGLKWWQK